jgi:DNA-binding response OmpR family regulator
MSINDKLYHYLLIFLYLCRKFKEKLSYIDIIYGRMRTIQILLTDGKDTFVGNANLDVLKNPEELKTQLMEKVPIGNYSFHSGTQKLQLDGLTCRLTQREAKILEILNSQRGRVVERGFLLSKIWGCSDYFTSRSLDVHIYSLRRYLEHDKKVRIETIRGKGLLLSID